MRFLSVSLLAAMALILSACTSEPEAREVGSGTAPTDRRIQYTIYEYVEPYAV